MSKKVNLAVIGSGWRAQFFVRIAKFIPDVFSVTAVLVRDKEKGEKFAKEFDVKVVQSLDDLCATKPDYAVLAIKREAVPEYLKELYIRKMPVLTETPPADTIEELNKVWLDMNEYGGKVQVAEQYFAQPLYAAWLKVIADGKLGDVQNISISALHGYHAVSMIRAFLGADYENATIFGKKYTFDVIKTQSRAGILTDGEHQVATRERITLEFDNGKVAFFDFGDPQYHSTIRTRQLNIQGSHGEIDDLSIKYLNKDLVGVNTQLSRKDMGLYSNNGWYHHSLMLGEEVLYENPFPWARLNDDEIAIATCMLKMGEYVETGKEFYSMKEALQDTYLSIIMTEATKTPNKEIKTETQIWAK